MAMAHLQLNNVVFFLFLSNVCRALTYQHHRQWQHYDNHNDLDFNESETLLQTLIISITLDIPRFKKKNKNDFDF